MKMYSSARHFKILIATGLIIFSVHFQAFSQTYQVNGAAVEKGNGMVRMTTSQNSTNQTSSIWNTTKIDLNQSFDMSFTMFFGCNKDPLTGGDGMTFAFHNDPRGLNAIGEQYGFLGYGSNDPNGIRIKPAVAIEFDTYNGAGSGGGNEISPDHIAVDINGDVNQAPIIDGGSGPITFTGPNGPKTVQAISGGRDLEDCSTGSFFNIRVVWNPTAHTLQLYEEGTLTMTYTNDVVNTIFGGNSMVYWGFTGATGSAANEQWIAPKGAIIPWECTPTTSCCSNFTVTPNSPTAICNNPITLRVVNPIQYKSFYWSDGSSDSTLQISAPGTYTLNVLQNQNGNFCPGTATFTITPTGPTALILGGTTLCNNSLTTQLSVNFTGSSTPWNFVYAIDGVNQPSVTTSVNPYQFPANGSHVYTLVSVSDASGCSGSATGIATIDLYPGIPVGHDDVFTAPGTADLSVDNDGGTYVWYDAPTGGTQVYTGLLFSTPVLNTTTTYYVENTSVISPLPKIVSFESNAEGNGTDTAYNDHNGLPPAVLFINFTANSNFNFDAITCDLWAQLPWAASGINLTITDLTTSISTPYNPTYATPLTAGKHAIRVPLNYACTAGHNYRISYEGTGSLKGYLYWRMVTGYPINNDVEITLTGATQNESYPGLFKWEISVPSPSSSCGRTPVTAYTCPKATLSGDAAICNDGSTTPLSVALTGRYPITMTYAIDGVAQSPMIITSSSSNPFIITSKSGAHGYSLVSVSNNDCNGSVFGTATVTLTAKAPIGHDAVFSAPGTANLRVDDDGSGDLFEWYATPTGGPVLDVTTNFTTPVLNSTTTYYVNNASIINTFTHNVSFETNAEGNGADTAHNDHNGLPPGVLFINFTANSNFNFDAISCDVWAQLPWAASGINLIITDVGAGTSAVYNPTYAAPLTAGKHAIRVPLNYACTAGHNYRISYEGTGSLKGYIYWRMVTGYPINNDAEITLTGATQNESYPGLFKWEITTVSSTPACGRTPVTAYVCPTAILSGDAVICNDGTTTTNLSVALTGASPWTLTYAIDGVNQTSIAGITSNPYTITSAIGAHTYTLVSVSNVTIAGCANGTSGTATITVNPNAPVGHDATFLPGNAANLSVDNTGGTFNWFTTATGSISVNSTSTYSPTLTTTTTFYVQHVDGNGDTSCTRTPVTALLIVPTVPLFIPNLMTPNNDGKNDRFEILGLPDGSTLGVYNRWGNAVYQSDNYNNQWAAENISAGVYYYDLKLRNGEVYKGWLQIIW